MSATHCEYVIHMNENLYVCFECKKSKRGRVHAVFVVIFVVVATTIVVKNLMLKELRKIEEKNSLIQRVYERIIWEKTR